MPMRIFCPLSTHLDGIGHFGLCFLSTDGHSIRVDPSEGTPTIEVRGTSKDSLLWRVIDLLKKAQENKSRTRTFPTRPRCGSPSLR